jgi:3-methyl-2-oxobutanoate hydroxymethyltransferase
MSFAVDNGQAQTTPGPAMSLPRLREKKALSEPIVAVTTPDHALASVGEAAKADVMLLDARAGSYVLGHDTPAFLTVQEMLALAGAVRRAVHRGLLVVELPFGSWEGADAQAIASAIRFVKETGCDAVKVTVAGASPDRARAVGGAGVPVLGHVGFEPQSVSAFRRGDSRAHTAQDAIRMLERALALQEAGCFALLLEALPLCVVETLMPRLIIPAIGMGAGPDTDGQAIVLHTELNSASPCLTATQPAVVANVTDIVEAVRDRTFPAAQYSYDLTTPERESFNRLRSARGLDATWAQS